MQRFALVLAFAVTGLGLTAQAPVPVDSQFVKEFGADGAPGSFRVKFDAQGAGVVYVMTKDHFVDASAAAKAGHEKDDYMLLVWCGADYALRVGPAAGSGRVFAADLWTDRWEHADVDDGVRFTIDSGNGLRLHKTYHYRPAERGFAVELRLENTGFTGAATGLDLDLVGPTLVNRSELSLLGNPAVAIAQVVGAEAKHLAPDKAGARQPLLPVDGQELAMAGSTNRFFGGFVFPLDDGGRHAVTAVAVDSLPRVEDLEFEIHAHTMPRAVLSLRLPVPTKDAASVATFGVYLGPKSFRVFGESPERERFLPIMAVDLEPPCCGVSVPGGRLMATLLVKLLGLFHDFVGAWGPAIMLLTLLVRGALAPVNFHMQKSMRAYGKRMAVVKPKLDELKKRHGDDPKAYQQAMLQFQREHKLMPPIGGCLPIFLTMPIYIGLFTSLRTAYDLRQQSFLFMHDLSRPDALFNLPIWPHVFNLMPLLWISLMLVLQLRMPLPTDPQQRQMQQTMRFMPLMFGVMLYNYASGLLVYMVTSMLWTFVETAITKRILGPIDPNAAGMAPTPMM